MVRDAQNQEEQASSELSKSGSRDQLWCVRAVRRENYQNVRQWMGVGAELG